MSFEQFEPTRVAELNNREIEPNKHGEFAEKPDLKSPDFSQMRQARIGNMEAEALANSADHPTPEELLAGLDGAFGGATAKPRNSAEGGSQIAEGSSSNRENPTNA